MLRRLKTYSIFAGAVLFGLMLGAYVYVHELVTRIMHPSIASTLGAECTDPSLQAPQENPNKMLFISCGGFLE